MCPYLPCRVLDYHKKQRVKSYDRQEVLARLPFELRSKILRHLYLPTIAQVGSAVAARAAVVDVGRPGRNRRPCCASRHARQLPATEGSARSVPTIHSAKCRLYPHPAHCQCRSHLQVSLLKAMSEDDVFLTDLCVRLQPTHFSADTFVYMRGESGADVFILLQVGTW